jgi:glutaredoxin
MIKFYTTHCPKCEILKKKLDNKKIQYEEISDEISITQMFEKGYSFAPLLEVDNMVMNYVEGVKWVNEQQ